MLPTGFLPETAVSSELHYGSKKRITLYVSLSTEDAINSMERNIDGDASQDSQHPYQKTDKLQLETINVLGRKNILTGYTFYDIVEKQTRRNPEKLRTLRKTLINHIMKHTDPGEVSINFPDSMGGLDAKIDNDREGLRRSDFEGFEVHIKLKHTGFIDAFLPDTKVIIEQKSLSENLTKENRLAAFLAPAPDYRLQLQRIPDLRHGNFGAVAENFARRTARKVSCV